jgi:hypothetical protein
MSGRPPRPLRNVRAVMLHVRAVLHLNQGRRIIEGRLRRHKGNCRGGVDDEQRGSCGNCQFDEVHTVSFWLP